MIHIVLWKWNQEGNTRSSYSAEHVNVMCSMLHRNLFGVRHRIICVTDDPTGIRDCDVFPLWRDTRDIPNATKHDLPSCYRRLKLYDAETQRRMGIKRGDRIASIDLDALITGHLKALLATEGRFVGWQLKGKNHDVVFNGSFQMFTAGDLQEIWSEFDPATSPAAAFNAGYLGSDQSWLSWKLAGKEGSVGLEYPIVASYAQHTLILAEFRPETRIIFYHGKTKPWMTEAFNETPYPERYWR